jgi:3-oxoadipate enol-lactonase
MNDLRIEAVNGIRLATVDRGHGKPLLLVHGFPLDHAMWDAQVEAFRETHRVIAPDLRGFGRSDVTSGKVTMEQLADDLAGLVDALGVDDPVTLCGLSMGGYIAWQFWRKYASRLGGLIVCDTRAAADTPEAAAARRATADQVLAEGPATLADSMIPKLFAEITIKSSPATIEGIRRVILNADPEGIAAAQRGMAQRPDVTQMLAEITCPTLVIVGAQDVISPVDEMRAIAESVPGAGMAVIPDAGHMAPVENPEEVNRVIREFLDEKLTAPGSTTGS